MDENIDIKKLVELLMDPNPEIQQQAMELVGGFECFKLPDKYPVKLFNLSLEDNGNLLTTASEYIDRLIKFLVDLARYLTNTNLWLTNTLNNVKQNYKESRVNSKATITKNLSYVTVNYRPQLDYQAYVSSLTNFKKFFEAIVNYQHLQFSQVIPTLINELKKESNDSTIVSLVADNNIVNAIKYLADKDVYLLGNRELLLFHGVEGNLEENIINSDIKLVPLDIPGKNLESAYSFTPYSYRQMDDITNKASEILRLLNETTNSFKIRKIVERYELLKNALVEYKKRNPDTIIEPLLEQYIYWNISPIQDFQKLGTKVVQAVCSTLRDS